MRFATSTTTLILAVGSTISTALQIPISNPQWRPSTPELEDPNLNTGDVYPPGFTLRHVFHHGTNAHPGLHRRMDVSAEMHLTGAPPHAPFLLGAVPRTATRLRKEQRAPKAMEARLAKVWSRSGVQSEAYDWVNEEILTPDVEDPQTLVALAKMTADAYVGVPDSATWVDVGVPFNQSSRFGWDSTGIRGHVFADETNSTVVVAIKGTSSTMFDNDGVTAPSDKVNDNLLFSCCCARISYMWKTVCDCYDSTYTCKQDCVEDALYSEDKYYRALLDMYANTTALYPDANVWFTGHSLGGSMAALAGRTYAVPTVAFEAPPERLAARRLHLPFPPIPESESMIWHFGNTADPIYMGVCNGPSSLCWMGGYAMETQCHSGMECVYDTVADKKWRVSMSSHRIRAVVDMIESYNTTASCIVNDECQDCFDWTFT
ncbi:Alpha/Beta hydrolase protein [Limtongia smithiae]|uniref:Alpha/Beta hydrolase protein n=1 Tax=Limtongia smithiae TaxID=1125753 RepID=UPI0034CEFCDD